MIYDPKFDFNKEIELRIFLCLKSKYKSTDEGNNTSDRNNNVKESRQAI